MGQCYTGLRICSYIEFQCPHQSIQLSSSIILLKSSLVFPISLSITDSSTNSSTQSHLIPPFNPDTRTFEVGIEFHSSTSGTLFRVIDIGDYTSPTEPVIPTTPSSSTHQSWIFFSPWYFPYIVLVRPTIRGFLARYSKVWTKEDGAWSATASSSMSDVKGPWTSRSRDQQRLIKKANW